LRIEALCRDRRWKSDEQATGKTAAEDDDEEEWETALYIYAMDSARVTP
jgi:hypothetical protein